MMRMVHAMELALSSLTNALEARRLYTSDHPVARDKAREARDVIARCTAAHPGATALLLPDRVVVGDEPLPGGAPLARGSLKSLHTRGVAAIQLRSEPSADDIDAILRCMEDAKAPLVMLDCLIFHTAVAARAAAVPIANPLPSTAAAAPTPLPEDAATQIREAFAPVERRGALEAAGLATLAGELAGLVMSRGDALIPLAGLRSHDEYTYVHTLNVAMLAGALAETIGLSADKVRDITYAAMLHDVGKSRTPPELLNKGGKLSDGELAIIRRHPVDGARILIEANVELDLAIAVTYEHHMHMTGGGYPKAPPGYRMHAASRVVQVADVFDALRTNRPYRGALSIEQARELMYKDAGRVFEPALLDVFFTRVATRTVRHAA